MPLDMHNHAIWARQDLAFAMKQAGFPVEVIQEQLKYSTKLSVVKAIRLGSERAKLNENRVSPRCFGVEIEFFGTTKTRVRDEILRLDPEFPVEIQSYNHHVVPVWKLITDASVNSSGTRDDSGYSGGLEMVSPILNGKEGFDQLKLVLEAINNVGGKVDRSCGLHVHHDARELSPGQLVRLLEFYMENQKTIDHLIAPSRRSGASGNGYCGPWTDMEKRRVMEQARNGHDLSGFPRYRTVNVLAYARYGSIEFRQHQGTLNYEKVSQWVRFGQALVESSMTTYEAPVQTFEPDDVLSMLEWLVANGGMPKTTADSLNNKAEGYNARTASRRERQTASARW